IDDRIRMQLLVEKIAKAKGIDPTSPDGNQRLTKELSATSKSMNIDVNPRYGRWDTDRSTLTGAKTPWLRDLSGEAAQRPQQM
ncbi:hypothetical protein AN219_29765, partial [Streptomyces nanshensis]